MCSSIFIRKRLNEFVSLEALIYFSIERGFIFGGGGLRRDVGTSERQYDTELDRREIGGENVLSLVLGSSRGHQWQ